jgi:hypothetical protein
MRAKSCCFVKPLSRLLRGPRQPASRPSSDVRADNKQFCCKAASSPLRGSRRQVVTVTHCNRTLVIVPHPNVRASVLALKAGIPARHAASSRRPPGEYPRHASCNRAAARSTCEPEGPLRLPGCSLAALKGSPPPCALQELRHGQRAGADVDSEPLGCLPSLAVEWPSTPSCSRVVPPGGLDRTSPEHSGSRRSETRS